MKSMKSVKRVVAAATFATALALTGAPTLAADKPVTLRFASNAPATSPWAMQIDRVIKNVAELSKGTVKIEAFYGGQLGNEQDTIQQVARGRIDMGGFSAGAVSLVVPEIQLAIIPFYFDGPKEGDCMLDNVLKKPFTELLDAKGVKLMNFGEVGEIALFGKKPFVSLDDVKGVKAVAYSKVQSIMWTALGANSSFVGVPEWVSSIQTGVIDVVGSIMALYVPSGMNKVAPVMTRNYMWNTPTIFVVSKATWGKLSPDQQKALEAGVTKESAAQLRAEIRGMEEKLRGAHLKGGGQIVEPTPAQIAEWRKVVEPTWPSMVKEIGGKSEEIFKTIVAARPGCKQKS